MMGMAVLRYATLVALAVWIGGLLALGAVAAPAIFQVVADQGVPAGRALSGAIFGGVADRLIVVKPAGHAFPRARAIVRETPPRVASCTVRRSTTAHSGWMEGLSLRTP